VLDRDPAPPTERGAVRLCGFGHIPTSSLGVGASRASFIAVFGRSLLVMVRQRSTVCYETILLFVLSVTLVYYGQTVGRIKMPLRMEISLGSGATVLDRGPAPPRKGAQQPPTFRSMSIVAKRSPISATAALLFCYIIK